MPDDPRPDGPSALPPSRPLSRGLARLRRLAYAIAVSSPLLDDTERADVARRAQQPPL